MPTRVKVFEIDSYVDKKTKAVSRRFVDQLSYWWQKDFFQYKNPSIGASHILREDGTWEQWNGDGWRKIGEPVIVNKIEELNRQEL